MKKAIAGIALALAAMTTPASADWIHQKLDDPFQGDQHMALGADDLGGFVAIFVCSKADDLSLVFISPEKVDADTLAVVNNIGPHLAVVIDDMPKREFNARVSSTPDGGSIRIRVEDAGIVQIAADAARANRRIALAGVVNGKVTESHSFNPDGSGAAIRATLKACGVNAPNDQ
ncbi:hypothetical protein [Hyphomicrobium sp. MC8b]|uniref:hypothetical protein n=1 Tax=Hyphomicrobium sp. MC8b TaxID=300273 RepID=UPI00391A82F8